MPEQPTKDLAARKLEWLARYRQEECARAYNAYVQSMTNPRGVLRPCS